MAPTNDPLSTTAQPMAALPVATPAPAARPQPGTRRRPAWRPVAPEATPAGGEAQPAAKDYRSDKEPIWCPGCGDYGVLSAVTEVFAQREMDPDSTVLVSGIGCSSRFPTFIKGFGFHSVHGRALPVATGVAMANPRLDVVVVGGDGDGLSIGGGHFTHACRRNPNMTYLMLDNEIYGLTKGQVSPTTTDLSLAKKALTTPFGTWEWPLDPVSLALAYQATFVARAYSARRQELVDIIDRAIEHDGFSFVQVISPCASFYNSFRAKAPHVKAIDEGHDTSDRAAATVLAGDPAAVWLGVFYQDTKPTLRQRFRDLGESAMKGRDHQLGEVFARYL